MQWLQKIIKKKSPQQGIVGISFLPHGMTIAVADYCEDNSVKLTHCEYIETEKNDEYPAILKHWQIVYQLDNYDCHLVLDINDYQRINIEAPNVPVNEMCMAIRWKVHDLLDFPLDETVLDYYHAPTVSVGNASIEVIASPHSIIKPLIEHCVVAGLNLKVIEIQETTLRNLATLLPNSHLGGVAVLYLQKSFGIILIQKKGVIYVARKIAIGYEQLELDSESTTDYEGFALEIDNRATEIQDNLALEIQRSLDYVDNYYNIGTVAELAVIPWSETTQTLVDTLNEDYGIYSYLMDISYIVNHDNLKLDYPIQSLCLPVIGATLRNTVVTA
jgi:MSHA biogenesis protein MshI